MFCALVASMVLNTRGTTSLFTSPFNPEGAVIVATLRPGDKIMDALIILVVSNHAEQNS